MDGDEMREAGTNVIRMKGESTDTVVVSVNKGGPSAHYIFFLQLV
jgi:hypothetical protein